MMVVEEVEEGERLPVPDLGRGRMPEEEELELDTETPVEMWCALQHGLDRDHREEEETEGRTGHRGTTMTGRKGTTSTFGGTGKWGEDWRRNPGEEDQD